MDRKMCCSIREKYEDRLLKIKNVVGVGVGDKEVGGKKTKRCCVRVYVEKKTSIYGMSLLDIVPETLEGAETDVIEVGKIVALANTQRLRPTKCGISIGHYKITAGTLGAIVKDKQTGEILILSNNHVLAQSNAAKIGDDIIQPGTYDKGTVENDLIAKLVRFVKISFTTWKFWIIAKDNLVDCAVAKPISDDMVTPEVLEIGVPVGTVMGKKGMKIQKSGRTTGYTKGVITDDDATVTVGYGGSSSARFKHQLMAGAMSAGGDSGSLVLDENKNAVGLLFAGSDKTTVICRIENVLSLLNVELVTK